MSTPISLSVAPKLNKGVAKALQLSSDAGTKFLSSHGALDEGHLVKISSAIDSIQDPKVGHWVSNAVMINYRLFEAMLS